jgi:hypothetical protein
LPCMYVPLNSFFPSRECLVWLARIFDLSNSFVFVSFVFAHGERDQVTASVFQSANYVPLNSLFSFPRMLHRQQFVALSNSFVFVCLSPHIVEGMKSQASLLCAAKHVPLPSPNVVFCLQYV